MIHPGSEREVALGDTASLAQEHVTLAEIDAGGADVPTGDRGFLDHDPLAGGDRVLLDHDGVRATGNDAAGEDPYGLAGADRPGERSARRDFADHGEFRIDRRGIGRAHRVAVHRRHRLRRLRAPRRDVTREHAMVGLVEGDHFFRQRLCTRQHRSKRVGNRHQGHGENSCSARSGECSARLLAERGRRGKNG